MNSKLLWAAGVALALGLGTARADVAVIVNPKNPAASMTADPELPPSVELSCVNAETTCEKLSIFWRWRILPG